MDLKARDSRRPRVVIFAHVPPPFHGQSYMVQLLLENLRTRENAGRLPLRFFHVDARYSSSVSDIGSAAPRKIFLALRYVLQAIWLRVRHRAHTLYYIPAPARPAAMYRDWIVLMLCRPFFSRLVLHWQALGLAEWTRTAAKPWEAKITMKLLGQADLSIVLTDYAIPEVRILAPRKIRTIENAIPDPCADYDEVVRPLQARRCRARVAALKRVDFDHGATFTMLFIGTCSATKGLFAAIEATALLHARLVQESCGIHVRLCAAGEFVDASEEKEFDRRVRQPDLVSAEGAKLVEYVGFADPARKSKLFEQADCFVFPSAYPFEAQPVAIIEALAYNLPVVATRWRGIPDLLKGSDAFLVDDQNPEVLARTLRECLAGKLPQKNRALFCTRHHIDRFTDEFIDAIVRLGD